MDTADRFLSDFNTDVDIFGDRERALDVCCRLVETYEHFTDLSDSDLAVISGKLTSVFESIEVLSGNPKCFEAGVVIVMINIHFACLHWRGPAPVSAIVPKYNLINYREDDGVDITPFQSHMFYFNEIIRILSGIEYVCEDPGNATASPEDLRICVSKKGSEFLMSVLGAYFALSESRSVLDAKKTNKISIV